MNSYQCKICGNSSNNQSFIVREMMFGTREKFTYFKCSSCGCLQIAEIPEDITKFYPKDSYYSYQYPESKNTFRQKLKKRVKCFCFNVFYCYKNLFFLKRLPYFRTLEAMGWVKLLLQEKAIKKTSAILDVGCGAGLLLQEMNNWGFKNLTGIDPFIEKDISNIVNGRGYKVLKESAFEHNGFYDLIMLHHAFEHIDNPLQILKRLHEMLSPQGILLIRIPVSDCYVWRKYGINWFQIDAPRHFFLHTTSSMTLLSKEAEFVFKQVIYDSTEAQFIQSEKYCKDIPFFENLGFMPSNYLQNCKKQARLLNQMMDGDQACFLFQKK